MSILEIKTKKEYQAVRQPICSILAEAFYTDPFYQSIMPDNSSRRQHLYWWMSIMADYAFKYGKIYYDQNLRGAALWAGYKKPQLSDLKLALMGLIWHPVKIGVKSALKMMRITSKWTKVHKTIQGQHYYLMILGVLPQWHKKGLGKALISPVLKDADRRGYVCYLETAKAENLIFYGKNGFEILEKSDIENVDCWMMLRKPTGDSALGIAQKH